MTSQEVIRMGEQITKPQVPLFNETPYFLVLTIIAICFCILIWVGVGVKKIVTITVSTTVILMAISFFLTNPYNERLKEYNEDIVEWKEEAAYPYIKTLTPSKQPLDTVIMNVVEMEGQTFRNALPLIISYKKDDTIITTSDTYIIEKSLEEGEKPVLEYILLNENLGPGVIKGAYYQKILLPKDFK